MPTCEALDQRCTTHRDEHEERAAERRLWDTLWAHADSPAERAEIDAVFSRQMP